MEYSTSEIARLADVHTNTVRFYEEIGFLQPVKRKSNGYRIFTNVHRLQLGLIRIAYRSELVGGGLRRLAAEVIRDAAAEDYINAHKAVQAYACKVAHMKTKALDAVQYAREHHLSQEELYRRYGKKEILEQLGITADALRHWERSGLIVLPRDTGGRLYFTDTERKRLTMISALRDANYSTMAILKMLAALEVGEVGMLKALEADGEDLFYATDRLLSSLCIAGQAAVEMAEQLIKIEKQTLQ
jgi:DNA-binding transcriptional MerR regulator